MEHPALRSKAEDEFCCYRRLIGPTHKTQCNQIISRYQHFIRKIRYNRGYIAINPALALVATIAVLSFTAQGLHGSALSNLDQYQTAAAQYSINPHHQIAAARIGGLEPSDYVDEAGELEVMANQQQIPTAQLMSAAGHIVPENFFLPGGTIPALYSQYQQQQQQQQRQADMAAQQVAASQAQARHLSPLKYLRQADLLASAATASGGPPDQAETAQLIDYNSYNNLIAQQDGRDAGSVPAAMDLAEFLSPAIQSQALYEQQQQKQQQQQQLAEQQLSAEIAALQQHQHQPSLQYHQHLHHMQQQQHQHHQTMDNSAQSSENSLVTAADGGNSQSIGPAYQISGHNSQEGYGGSQEKEKPYGLPTKSSNKEPSGMLKPLGNPKTISSPVIDFVTNQLPKTSNFEKLADKLPQHQTPTVFSFASSKDPVEKVKSVNQKKRNVMRQAEQLAKAMIKSVNEKFGTTIGDQTDIPFLLSSLGPLGIAQNILFDPSLLITLLNSAEKTYFADALPAPAKLAMRPVLNIFRVPNRKRDKANLLNIISYLASGGQTPSSPASNKNRQALGVEKQSSSNNSNKIKSKK